MKLITNTQWKGKMSFESAVGNHKITMDTSPDHGGEDSGPGPKSLILTALAGCTGMDIVSLLNKMQVPFDSFNILTEGITADEHPKRYTAIRVVYQLTGAAILSEKVEKAILLSIEKYCGVAATLKKAVHLTFEMELNGIRTMIEIGSKI